MSEPGPWGSVLLAQLDFYLDAHLRPRLEGLTDEEFFWEPAPGSWTVRRGGAGGWVLDGELPEPSPPPVTTIAWRLNHVASANLGSRANTYFNDGSTPVVPDMFDDRSRPPVAGTAAEAVALLETMYRRWRDGIAGLSDEQLMEPLGPRGNFFANEPMAALVVHVSRETMHHGGEIGVLRDLYRARR